MWLVGYWLWGLTIGVILLDLGTRSNQVSNQARIYLNPEGRSRLTTVFMVAYFIGGSLGSYLGTLGWSLAGWNRVCDVGWLLIALALVVYAINSMHAIRFTGAPYLTALTFSSAGEELNVSAVNQ